MVNRFFAWGVLRPLPCLAILGLLCLVAVPGFLKVRMNSSADGLRKTGDPAVEFFEETKRDFGDASVLSIMVEADDLFHGDLIEAVRDLTERSKSIDGVTQVISLSTVTNLIGKDGALYTDQALATMPETPTDRRQLREDVLGNSMLVGEVINASGTVAALHLFLESRPDEPMFERRLLTEVERELDRVRERLGKDVRLFTCGFPFVKVKVLETIRADIFRLTPLACLAMFAILLFHFRSVAAALIPNLTGVLSVFLTLGFMGHVGIPINPLTTIVPILVLVIGSTEDVHLTCTYARALADGLSKREALLRLGPECGIATFLTAGTTFAGFAALIPSRIPMLSQFGLACSFGMAINFLVTVLFVPVFLNLVPTPVAFLKQREPQFDSLRKWLILTLEHHGAQVGMFFSVFAFVAFVGLSWVTVDTDYLAFFRKDSEVVRIHEEVAQKLVGTQVFMVVLECQTDEDFQNPKVLAEAARLSDFIQSITDKVVGYPDFIRKLNREFAGGDDRAWAIPDSQDLISQFTLLLAEEDLERFVSPDFRRASLWVRSSVRGSAPLNQLIREIENAPKALGCETLTATATGDEVLIARTSDAMSRQLLISLSFVFAVIVVCLAITCRSWQAGFLGIIPNLFPVLMLFGLMGWLGITLSTATYPVAIIALGIAVDDTIHFLVRFFDLRREGDSGKKAMGKTIRQELVPIVSTSVALVGGFLVASTAELACIQLFGLLGAYVMIMALIADLLITPLLLRRTSDRLRKTQRCS